MRNFEECQCFNGCCICGCRWGPLQTGVDVAACRITWLGWTPLRGRTGKSIVWSLKVTWYEITRLEVACNCFIGVMKCEVVRIQITFCVSLTLSSRFKTFLNTRLVWMCTNHCNDVQLSVHTKLFSVRYRQTKINALFVIQRHSSINRTKYRIIAYELVW
jgi:hypothetical protein